MDRSMERARVLVLSLLLSVPVTALGAIAPPAAAAADPIIDAPSLPCAVIVGQPTWLDPPDAKDDSYTREGLDRSLPADDTYLSLTIPAPGVLTNDTPTPEDWRVALYSPPSHAAAFSLSPDGSFTYRPVPGYFGSDSFTYVRYLSGGQCSTGAVVTIAAANHIRIKDDALTVYANETYSEEIAVCSFISVCGVLRNDIGIDRNTRVADVWATLSRVFGSETIRVDPGTEIETEHGHATVFADGTLTYTPDAGYTGPDELMYQPINTATGVQGISGLCPSICSREDRAAKIRITVIDRPPPTVAQGVADAITLDEDTPTTILPSTLLANDISSHSIIYLQTALVPSSTHRTQHGTLTISYSDFISGAPTSRRVSSILYTPDPDYHGPDVFRYYVASGFNDGWNLSDFTGTVAIDVRPVADAPKAVLDLAATGYDQPITIDLIANDTDAEGDIDPTTVGRDPDPCRNQQFKPPSCPDSDSGWDLLARGTWVSNGDGTVTYTPAPGNTQTGEFPYQVCDRTGRCGYGLVGVQVMSIAPDSYTTNEDVPLVVGAPGVLGNDRTGATATLGETTEHGTLALQADGSFSYTPDADFNGTDSFTYTNFGSTATVTIDVTAVNDQPVLFVNDWCDRSIPLIVCLTEDDRFGDEGDSVVLNGSLEDVEFDPGTLVVDWGDGTTTTSAYPCVGQAGCPFTLTPTYSSICIGPDCADLYFRFHHTYADDPAGADDRYDITVTITEGDGTFDRTTTGALARNVAPTLTISPEECGGLCIGSHSNLIVSTGEESSVAGRIADPGADTGTLTIDWGDGSEPMVVGYGCSGDASSLCPTPSLQPAGCGLPGGFGRSCGYFEVPYTYADAGVYTVTVTVADDDGGSDEASAQATVSSPDGTDPTITASATTSDGEPYAAGTWTNQDVTIRFTCDDDSGVVTCSDDVTVSDEGSTASVGGTATDGSGNTASASFGPIRIDKTAPTITASATTADGVPYTAGSTTNQPVTVRYTCGDAGGSGLASCPEDETFTSSDTATGTATDGAGNTESTSFGPIVVDATAPTITASATTSDGEPYTAGTWTNRDVTIQFECSDESATVACPDDVTVADEGLTTIERTATDGSGNSASTSFGPIRIDKTAPTIVASATAGGRSYVAGTSTNQDVTVHYTCADAGGSGVASCPDDETVTSSGEATGTATDGAGNSASTTFGPIVIDKVGPDISFGTTCPTRVVLGSAVSVTWNASDPGSGLVGPSQGTIRLDTSRVGARSVSKTVVDAAGTSSTATCAFHVGYHILGFFPPVSNSNLKPGQTVVVRIALADAGGTRLRACDGCSVTFRADKVADPSGGPATGQSTGPATMKYDAKDRQYSHNWRIGPARQGTGPTRLLVTVTYPDGTTTTLSALVAIAAR
jgi:VCBS repeat-containing protein